MNKVSELSQQLNETSDDKTTTNILRKLGKIRSPEACRSIRNYIEREVKTEKANYDVLAKALKALAPCPYPENREFIVKLLKERHLISTCAKILGNWRSIEACEPLLDALDFDYESTIVLALIRINDDQTIKRLVPKLNFRSLLCDYSDDQVNFEIIHAIAEHGNEIWFNLLHQLFGECVYEGIEGTVEVINAIAATQHPDAPGLLISCVNEIPDDDIVFVIRALSFLGGSVSYIFLKDLQKKYGHEPGLRHEITDAMPEIETEERIKEFTSILERNYHNESVETCWAIIGLLDTLDDRAIEVVRQLPQDLIYFYIFEFTEIHLDSVYEAINRFSLLPENL